MAEPCRPQLDVIVGEIVGNSSVTRIGEEPPVIRPLRVRRVPQAEVPLLIVDGTPPFAATPMGRSGSARRRTICGASEEALAVAPRTDLDTGVLVAPT